MKLNQGQIERVLRFAFGMVLLAWGFTSVESGFNMLALMVVGIVLMATGLIAYCPVWHMLGISTRRGSK